jgi:Fe2+ or Zn2+ uptake regulation protein
MDDHEITQSLSRAAAKTGFVVSGAVIEVDGICGECAG